MFPADSMKQLQGRDGNISALLNTREQYQDRNLKRTIQMHSSLVQRLDLETVMEGHQGCVNALSWNSRGSLLLSGSDDTRVNVWDYSSQKLLHSVESGHSTNIFCVKFLPETDDEIVASGAGDAEVRVHRLSRAVGGGYGTSRQMLVNNCHVRRVKKLAVEEGNPHVVWSASEDGTLRQHDLREDVPCPDDFNHDCRKVLLDLRNASKKSLSDPPRSCLGLKTCAINAVRPHQLLVGGSDAFARLYDRRKLPPPSLSRGQAKTPDCVCYYCPTHLSDLNRSSSLHLTHVAFSPDGQEVLLSYSGEHVYLMDVNTGKDNNSIAYEAADVPKRLILAPIINDANIGIRKENSISKSTPNSIKFARMEMYGQLLCGAKNALRDRKNSHYVVEMASEVLDVRDPLIVPKVRHDFLCIRAEAFLKRLWKNDIHMAIRDCIEARAIDSRSVLAHSIMSDALFELQKHKEALDFAVRAHSLDPSNTGLSEKVKYLQSKLDTAEEAKNKRNIDDGDKNVDKKALNMAYIGDFLFRSESDQFDLSPESRQSEMEDSDVDDVEMEMEIEMSLPVDGEIGHESGSRSGSSLNLRLRRRRDQSAEHQTRDQASSSDRSIDDALIKTEVAFDMKQRYVGHCNVGTDIKQASFLGEKGEYVASGSDDGRWFIWQKKTGRLIKILKGDKNVVNCVQCHPFDAAIATSGIDNTIKMWSPVASVASLVSGGEDGPESSDVLSIMAENQQKMQRRQGFGLPQLFQRFTIPEVGIRPFECTQS